MATKAKPVTAYRSQVTAKRTTMLESTSNRQSPIRPKAASLAGEMPTQGVSSAYAIMASRLAKRLAEIAEGITIVERQKPPTQEFEERKRPRKLDMRLNGVSQDSIAFSAPFLDNTLDKMLQLQTRMLKSNAELSASKTVSEKVSKQQASQSAQLSRVIALICAEKAMQSV